MVDKKKYTPLPIYGDTKDKVDRLCRKSETYDEYINRLIETYLAMYPYEKKRLEQ